jgi:hypothetical protein
VLVTANLWSFLHDDDFAPFVEAAVGAGPVGQAHFATVIALDDVFRFERVMGSASIATGSRGSLFGDSHSSYSYYLYFPGLL